jgi:hypothetical protein
MKLGLAQCDENLSQSFAASRIVYQYRITVQIDVVPRPISPIQTFSSQEMVIGIEYGVWNAYEGHGHTKGVPLGALLNRAVSEWICCLTPYKTLSQSIALNFKLIFINTRFILQQISISIHEYVNSQCNMWYKWCSIITALSLQKALSSNARRLHQTQFSFL